MQSKLRHVLSGSHLLAFMPAMTLAAFWLGGEAALIALAILIPSLMTIAGIRFVDPWLRWNGSCPTVRHRSA